MTLSTDIMDRYSMDELLEMAATARLYLAGSLVYRGGRPLPVRFFAALDLFNAGVL